MSETNINQTETAEAETPKSAKTCRSHHHRCDKRRSCWRGLVALVLVVFGTVAVANYAIGGSMGGCKSGDRGDKGGKMITRMLDDVDASDAQKEKVKAIFESHQTTLKSLRESGRSLHQEMRALMSAETIDRAAIEKLRQQKVAEMDQVSKEMTSMMTEIAEVLKPEQRQAVAEKMEKHFERGHAWRDRGDRPDRPDRPNRAE